MTEPISENQRVLALIKNQKYSDDLGKNLIELNASMKYVSDYLLVMQKGVDDASKDIIQKFGDFVDELIILFSGGTGLDFGLDGLKPFFDNLGSIFGLDNLMEAIGQNPIIKWINNMIAALLDGIDGATGGFFNLDELADRLRGTENKAIIADDNAKQALDGNAALTPVVRQTVTDIITISAPFADSYETMVPGQQVSFPRALLNSSVKDLKDGVFSGTAQNEQVIIISDSQDPNVYLNFTRKPRYYPVVNSMESVYILSNYAVGRATVTFAVDAVTGTPCPMYVYISRMLTAPGSAGDVQIEWISPNQTPLMTNGRAERTITLPGIEEIQFDIGEYMVITIHQFGTGTVRPIIGLEYEQIGRSSDLFPPQQKMHFIRSSLPAVGDKIAKANQIFNSNFVPWVGIGQRLYTGDPLPRVWYDDFNNRADLGNKWTMVGDQPVFLYDGYFQYLKGAFITAGTARAIYNQPMNYDDQRVIGQAVGNKQYGEMNVEPAKLTYRSNANGKTFCSLDVRSDGVTLARMVNNTPYVMQGPYSITNIPGDWFKVEVIDNVHSVYKKAQNGPAWSFLFSFVDTGYVISTGEGFRYCGASTQRSGLNTSGGWNNWQAEDAVEMVEAG